MLRFELINSKEMDKYVGNKHAMIIYVRDKTEFNEMHITDAVNIPIEKLEAMYDKMPKDFIYVLYCNGGGTGILAAKELFDRGHITRALLGGINAYDGNYIESE